MTTNTPHNPSELNVFQYWLHRLVETGSDVVEPASDGFNDTRKLLSTDRAYMQRAGMEPVLTIGVGISDCGTVQYIT